MLWKYRCPLLPGNGQSDEMIPSLLNTFCIHGLASDQGRQMWTRHSRGPPCKTRKVSMIQKRTLGTLEGIIYTFFLLDLIYDIFSAVHSTGNLCCTHIHTHTHEGFPGGASGKASTCSAADSRHGFNPWVRKIPWRRKWQPTPVLLPGESPWTEEPAVHGVTKSRTWPSRHTGHTIKHPP